MSDVHTCDEDLIRRLPLPVAQLYRRAHNAKTPQERHHAAYYLWEAALKLLGSVAVVAYAELDDLDPELAERLQNLARPSVGHWWEFVRRLVPVLADRRDRGFAAVRDLLLGRSRDDLPHAAGLDAVLLQVLEGREGTAVRTSVRVTELFDRLVRYRNREIGHGAVGQRTAAFYDRVGRALLAGAAEVFDRLDLLAGRRLLYVADVRRQAQGRWLVERYELRGETSRRLESLDLPDGEAVRRLLPERLYLESLGLDVSSPPAEEKGASVGSGFPDQGLPTIALYPLLVYDADSSETLFLNARRGRQRVEYLSYHTGREVERADLTHEQRALLARVLHVPVDAPSVAGWAARSQAEEQAEGVPEEPSLAPRRLGEFELLSELGRGGMGVVYRAWQPSLGRQVAVKALFRTGDPKAEARFAREIRALGRVEHPHLVKIFLSGSEGERWYYAMELVEGTTLAAVCDKLHGRSSSPETVDFRIWQEMVSTACAEARQAEKSISDVPANGREASAHWPAGPGSDAPAPVRLGQSYVRQAVELVRQVAEAAHALHERNILHRDIKPGNVMVTAEGNQAVLMDLGLAQIADEVQGRLTKTRQFVGTLRYASPEQVLAVGGLDRRSDVYNLGATLWELLTLRPLFNATDQMPTPELMRRIQVEEPERPRKYHHGLAHDLEAIILKCLEKDPARRYATARELVRDLDRYLAGEPVQARPVGGLQRSWRWCRRNPALASMLAALALVLFGSLIGLTALYLNAEKARANADQQRRMAEHREAESRAVTRFYKDYVLAAARPKGWAGGASKDITVLEALDNAAPKIDEAFAGQPELEAAVRHSLGVTYWYLGRFEAANPQLEKAYQIRRQRLGPDHADTLTSLHDLAMLRWKQDKLAEAIRLARQALEMRKRVLGAEHVDTLFTQLNLGLFLLEDNQLDEAELLLREAIESCRRTLDPEHHHTLYGQNDLALVLWSKGKQAESVALDRQTLEGRRRSLGPEHPDTLRSMGNLAGSLGLLGKYEEAEALERQALEGRRRVLGPDHMETLWSQNGLANVLGSQGKLDEAEELYRQTLATRLRLFGPEHSETLTSKHNVAWVLQQQGKSDEAEKLFRETLGVERRVLGPENPSTLNTQSNLASAVEAQGKWEEAEKLWRQTLECRRRVLGPENPATLLTQNLLASMLGKQGKLKEAEELHRQTLETRRRVLGADHTDSLWSQGNLASVLQDQGKLEEAEKLFRQTLESNRRVFGPENRDTLRFQNCLASLLGEWGRMEDADKLFREVLAVQRKTLRPDNLDLAGTLTDFGDSLANNGRPAEAEPLLRECLAIRGNKLPPDHWQLASARSMLGGCLVGQKKFAEAEPLLLDSCELLAKGKGASVKQVTKAFDRIVALYIGWSKPQQAEEWRKKRPQPGK